MVDSVSAAWVWDEVWVRLFRALLAPFVERGRAGEDIQPGWCWPGLPCVWARNHMLIESVGFPPQPESQEIPYC